MSSSPSRDFNPAHNLSEEEKSPVPGTRLNSYPFRYSGFMPICLIISFCSAVHVPDMSPCCMRSFF